MFHVERPAALDAILADGSREFGYVLNQASKAAFHRYARELQAWSKKINLTTLTREQDVAILHFLDSLACSPLLDPSTPRSLLDIGSGAGFPGLPLKIVHPGLSVVLLEPNRKKTAFLRHVIGTLDLKNAVVLSARLEDIAGAPDYQSHFDYIVTRAVRQDLLLHHAGSLLAPQGRIILYRTKSMDLPVSKFGMTLLSEHAYALPRRPGTRIFSVLGHA
jgi:16S rRNA (guanine(527)-N(7))-methyltransferase RsmG